MDESLTPSINKKTVDISVYRIWRGTTEGHHAEGVEGVEEIHDLHVWTIASGYNAMSAHAKLLKTVDSESAQSALSTLRHLSSEEFGIEHVTIQIEGEDMACTEDHAAI